VIKNKNIAHRASLSLNFWVIYWLPPLLCAVFIFLASSLPGEDIPSLFPFQDIFFHAIEYIVFAFFLSRAIKKSRPGLAYSRRLAWAVFLAVFYAVLDEFHQSFIPGRTASGLDVLIDTAAGIIGGVLYR